MVARLQQCIVLAWLLAAAAWTGSWWSRAPSVALSGLLVLSSAHAAFLALEFIAGYRVSRQDPLGQATASQCARAWVVESWAALKVFCWQQPFRSRAVADYLPMNNGHRGVVLLHGFMCNRGFWNPWLRQLRAAEHAFIAVDLEPLFGSIDHYVAVLDEAILRVTAATGLPPVLICHSMGGLAARAWLRTANPARVRRIVTIGTPHRGTWMARFGHSANGRQMRTDGEWIRQMESACTSAHEVPFTCWYSNCDNIVFPTSSATLPAADNRLVPGRGHVEMAFVSSLRQQTLALLDE
ncbi:acetoin dehydrogenase E2 subunit dihydrolipoyllysine-residue acetyltransferase [Variovorax sp. PBS-H4]|uniref:alpha/beta fold hydrolase n=1 Tax=Variovorax sp. PBS-H4 TaxID=434008 RepID=UPI0013175E73|nr:alpha/beta fold hydrolase [Variovorax sp. PBS-H4]VTU40660.1 acetoin dehydrogenase E2 subunit dihydrolipoyllysine-residue acetyltransferase [Variovorax sp. PBS-H4]